MRKKRALAAGTALVLALSLSACGDDGEDNGDVEDNDATTTTVVDDTATTVGDEMTTTTVVDEMTTTTAP